MNVHLELTINGHLSQLMHGPAGCASQYHKAKLLEPGVKVWLAAL